MPSRWALSAAFVSTLVLPSLAAVAQTGPGASPPPAGPHTASGHSASSARRLPQAGRVSGTAPTTPWTHRWSIAGAIAGSRIYDDEGSLGPGPAISGAIGYAWSRQSTLELSLGHARHERHVQSLGWETRPTTITVRAIREFGSARARPFVAGGVGVMHVRGTTFFRESGGPFSGPSVVTGASRWSATGLAFDLGGGVVVRVTDRWFVRPEFRVLSSKPTRPRSAPEPPYSMMQWSIGAGYRF